MERPVTQVAQTSTRWLIGPGRCSLLLLLFAAAWVVVHSADVQAQPAPSKEYQVKAACLLNFVQFIQWPASAFPDAKTPISVGVLGDDPFGRVLEQTFEDESIDGRKLLIKRATHVDELKACHLIFISKSEKERLSGILESLNAVSVVTVGEVDEFVQRGGIIKFYLEENKVRFEINVSAAERKALKISSQLLKRAKIAG